MKDWVATGTNIQVKIPVLADSKVAVIVVGEGVRWYTRLVTTGIKYWVGSPFLIDRVTLYQSLLAMSIE
jgi:hypothetical protein